MYLLLLFFTALSLSDIIGYTYLLPGCPPIEIQAPRERKLCLFISLYIQLPV